MRSWGCPSCHCHGKKLIEQLRPTVLSILTLPHYTVMSLYGDVMNMNDPTLYQFARKVSLDVHGIKIVWLSPMVSR